MAKLFSTKIHFDFRIAVEADGFDEVAQEVAKRWRFAQMDASPGSRSGVSGAMDWLTVVTYQLTEYLMLVDEFEVVADRLQRLGKRGLERPEGPDFFRLSIRALFAHEAQSSLSDSQRERIIKRCWYAYRHYIPPVMLAGFFKQIPNFGIRVRMKSSSVESEFRWWVITQKALRSAEISQRGAYSKDILKDVKRLQKAMGSQDSQEFLQALCTVPRPPS